MEEFGSTYGCRLARTAGAILHPGTRVPSARERIQHIGSLGAGQPAQDGVRGQRMLVISVLVREGLRLEKCSGTPFSKKKAQMSVHTVTGMLQPLYDALSDSTSQTFKLLCTKQHTDLSKIFTTSPRPHAQGLHDTMCW